MKSEVSDKSAKFHAVSEALFYLLGTLGPQKVTHTLVANRAKVSRAWLYKYIGKEKDDLIRFAIEHLGKLVTERDRSDVIENKNDLVKNIVLGMQRMFQTTVEYPWFIPVYFKYRGTPTTPGKVIDQIEQTYIARQALHFEKYFSYAKPRALLAAEILTSFRMGLAFSWQRGELSKKADSNEALAAIEKWLSEMFSA